MYEPSDPSEESKEEFEYNLRVNSEDGSIVDAFKGKENFEKHEEGDTPLQDTSLKRSSSEATLDADPIEKKKQYNPEEIKYPLEYHKYLKIRETSTEVIIKKKKNCFGNFGISLFWEEKFVLLIKYLQIYSLAYISVYEYWPYDFDSALGNAILGMGFNFVYLSQGYYKFIEKFEIYGLNIFGWVLATGLMIALGVTIIRVKKLRSEFKHSKTLLKKWAFNVAELLFIPICVNTIPMFT